MNRTAFCGVPPPNVGSELQVGSHDGLASGTPIRELTLPTIATTMVPFWEPDLPTTLTLKNIPDVVYERLRASAAAHRRSLNSEAIVCLESVLLPRRMTVEEQLERARELRASLDFRVTAKDLDSFKREGRP